MRDGLVRVVGNLGCCRHKKKKHVLWVLMRKAYGNLLANTVQSALPLNAYKEACRNGEEKIVYLGLLFKKEREGYSLFSSNNVHASQSQWNKYHKVNKIQDAITPATILSSLDLLRRIFSTIVLIPGMLEAMLLISPCTLPNDKP